LLLGGGVQYTYDSTNNVTSVTDQNNYATSYTYDDAKGNLTSATDANGKVTSFIATLFTTAL
jgi:YD repeat-containing protein